MVFLFVLILILILVLMQILIIMDNGGISNPNPNLESKPKNSNAMLCYAMLCMHACHAMLSKYTRATDGPSNPPLPHGPHLIFFSFKKKEAFPSTTSCSYRKSYTRRCRCRYILHPFLPTCLLPCCPTDPFFPRPEINPFIPSSLFIRHLIHHPSSRID